MPDFEDKIPISEFSYTNSLNNTDQMPIIQQDGAAWDNFRTSLADVGLHVNKVTQYTTDLHTTNDTIIGAINELADGGASADITTEITTPAPIQTFNDGGDNIPLKSLVTEIVPVQAGSGVPSPSNVRAISGHSAIEVDVCGKNIFSSSIVQGALYTSGSESSTTATRVKTNDYIVCKPNTQYVISFNSGIIPVSAVYYDKNKVYISGDNLSEATFTTPLNCAYVRLGIAKTNTTQSITPSDVTQSQLEEGTIATTYEPYNHTTHTISLGQTVYGGSLECVEGEGYSDGVLIDLANYTGRVRAVGENNNKYFRFEELADSPDLTKRNLLLCDKFPTVEMSVNNTNIGVDIIEPSTLGYTVIAFRPPNVTSYTTQTVMDYIQQTLGSLQVCYRKATPTSLSVTGANIATLSGLNNVYADCGDINALEYFNDKADDIASMVRLMTRT